MDRIKLGNLCKSSPGLINEYPDTIIDYIDISSVDNENKSISGYQTMKFSESPSRARKAVKKGNILVSTVRPNLNAVAILEDDTPNVSVASTGFCILDCKENVDIRFIFYFCRSKSFIDTLISKATGASYPAVSDKIVRSVLIPSYSFDEQRMIGEVLDKLSVVIASRKQELTELDNLIKARFVEMFGNPENNNKNWSVYKLGEICSVGSSKRILHNELSSEGVPFWRISDLISKIDTGANDSGLFIPESKYEDLKTQKLVPAEGDILVTSRGTLGRCYIVSADDRFYFQDGMITIINIIN